MLDYGAYKDFCCVSIPKTSGKALQPLTAVAQLKFLVWFVTFLSISLAFGAVYLSLLSLPISISKTFSLCFVATSPDYVLLWPLDNVASSLSRNSRLLHFSVKGESQPRLDMISLVFPTGLAEIFQLILILLALFITQCGRIFCMLLGM